MHPGETAAVIDRLVRRAVIVMVVSVTMVVVMMMLVVMVVVVIVIVVVMHRLAMAVRMARPVVVVVMGMGVRVRAAITVVVGMLVFMVVGVTMPGARLDRHLPVLATADRTHQATSSSLTRISSPAVTCSW
jgi:ABC-type uncharacterized transport system permease subunit